MPVERFRSIEAMNAATPRDDGEADVARFLRHGTRFRRLHPVTRTPGVHRFRNIEEAQERA